jgi:hypothetical protein
VAPTCAPLNDAAAPLLAPAKVPIVPPVFLPEFLVIIEFDLHIGQLMIIVITSLMKRAHS